MLNMMLEKLKTYFATGLFTVLPVLFALLLTQWGGLFVDGVIFPYIPSDVILQNIYGGSVAISIVFILIIGACVSVMFGKWIVKSGENVINAIAFLRTVYDNSKTKISMVLTSLSGSFNQTVLVQYPYKGARVFGFGTGDNTGIMGCIAHVIADYAKYIIFFVPTISNSTPGMLLIADKKDTKSLNISVKEAVQFFIMASIGQDVKALKGGQIDV